MTENPLAGLRARIDSLDDQLVTLLAQRYALLTEVVKVKAAHGIPPQVPARAEQVMARNEAAAQAQGLPAGLARRIWQLIIDAAHDYEGQQLPPSPPNR